MKINETILTNNPCYKANRKIVVKGLMLHSVGCSQPNASVFVKNWNNASFDRACVHAFIDANSGEIYQCLPWNHRGWHGSGSSNNTHIGVEMCEPDCITYIDATSFTCSNQTKAKQQVKTAYDSAVELFAYLCNEYNLNPLTDICSHKEGHTKGIASNHADPEHLWNGLNTGYTMNGFRQDVKNKMGIAKDTQEAIKAQDSTTCKKTIWDYLIKQGLTQAGVAGLMGNIQAESNFNSINLQNSYEKKLGMTDSEYTAAVDKGTYDNFVRDSAGYGLCQWTYWSRKQNLLNYAKQKQSSIGSIDMQLEFLMQELQTSYKSVLNTLKTTSSIQEASNAVLLQFERPADQSETVQAKRASFGQAIYDAYSTKETVQPTTPAQTSTSSYLIHIDVDALNIRKGPGVNYAVCGCITDRGVYTIVDTNNNWGCLKSGAGWICLDYCSRYEKETKQETTQQNSLKLGQKVHIKDNCNIYGTNNTFASFVYKSDLYIRDIQGDRIVISTLQSGAVTGAVNISDIIQ